MFAQVKMHLSSAYSMREILPDDRATRLKTTVCAAEELISGFLTHLTDEETETELSGFFLWSAHAVFPLLSTLFPSCIHRAQLKFYFL